METLLRERVTDALRSAVPRLAPLVAATTRCWGDIADGVESAELTPEEESALLDALVAVGDRNALLLFGGIFGVDRLALRGPDLPADLQAWLAAEGIACEGLGSAARALQGTAPGDEHRRARERAVYRAAVQELSGLRFRGEG